MKKILCVLLSLIMSVSLISIPLSAQAETKYWVDMNFAKNNIEGLRNYIKTKGKTNSDGDKYIQYVYDNKYNYLIIYETKKGALDFWVEFDDGEYVDMYYAYPNVNPELNPIEANVYGVLLTRQLFQPSIAALRERLP